MSKLQVGVLGTGLVGKTIGSKLIQLGYRVKMGSRTINNEKAVDWVKNSGDNASQGTFSDAASFGELLFNCTEGIHSIEALQQAGVENLKGKILIDIANALDFSKGMPPSLTICNTDSLGEKIQRTFPDTKVVKTLNTMNCEIMVNPALVPGEHDVFVSGNDNNAKQQVIDLLKNGFGWKSPIDLGDITTARGTEMILPIWVHLYGLFQTARFNFKIQRSEVGA